MENPTTKEEYNQEDLVLYNTIPPIHNSLDDKDSNNSLNFGDEKEETLNGRWNDEEHIRFIKGCLLYGNNWKKVKKYVKTRSSAQIRSHAQKYLIKLNKKYNNYDFGKNQLNNNDNSLDNELIENFINNFNYSNVDMDKVEKMILYIFKNSNGNYISLSERGYNGIDIDGMNFKDYSFSEKENNKIKNKEKIFKINKIPKDKKREYDLIEKNENNQFSPLLGKKRQSNKIDYSQMYNNSNGLNNFGIEPMKMIQIEKFINMCLDSNDPTELTKLFLFFNPNNYIINPMTFIEPNLIYSQQNRERDMYNSMKAYLNESYNNQSTNDLSGKTNSDNSLDNEKQKQINYNYQQTLAMEIAKINPNLDHLYSNTLNGLFNNYSNFNGFQNPIPINQYFIDGRFQNFNG
jgi:SHAQKYF class myb-like DNA-binding protein